MMKTASGKGFIAPFQGIIFDLDGTLLNTLHCIGSAFNQALDALQFPQHPIEDYAAFIGDGVFKCAERALPTAARTKHNISALVERERIIYDQTWQNHISVYDGIKGLLTTLQDNGVPTAVLTNKDQQAAETCLQVCFPNHHFSAIMGYTGAFQHKPSPDSGNAVILALGLDPSEIMMLGDTAVDIQTARACKLFAVGVSWGFRTRDNLAREGCDLLIDHPSHLLSAIESMRTTT